MLLGFSSSLARVAKVSEQTKCISLTDEPSMIRTTVIDLKHVELKYYSFIISLDKCNRNCNPKISPIQKLSA